MNMRNRAMITGAMLALAVSVQAFASPEALSICTGGEGGFYEKLGSSIGHNISKTAKVEVEVVNTGGSVENAELMKDGDCSMAVMQADAVITQALPPDIKVTDAHEEVVFWLHSEKGVNDFGKMENDSVAKKYAIGTVSGSGAMVTLRHWIETDKDYREVVVVEFEDWYQAAEAVAQGYVKKAGVNVEIAGMLYIGRAGQITNDITEDFGQQILIGEVNDASFANSKDANGNPLYQACAVDKKMSSGLQHSTVLDPDTYCLRAQIVYNTTWHEGDRKLRRIVDKSINGIVKAIR